MAFPEPNADVAVAIVRDDGEIFVVDKTSGRVTMPGAGHARDSVQNGVMAVAGERLRHLGAARDYGLLHRLDRASSGLLLFAQTVPAYEGLRGSFHKREVVKDYLAITARVPERPRGSIRARLAEVRTHDRKLARIDARGKAAVTHFKVLCRGHDGTALVECRIETGRLHQIRAHLASIGAPLLGDLVYTPSSPDGRASVARQADRAILLHAWRLAFPHPVQGNRVKLEAPLPARFREALTAHGLKLPSPTKRGLLPGRG